MKAIIMRSFALAALVVCSAAFTTDLMIKKCSTAGCTPMQKRVRSVFLLLIPSHHAYFALQIALDFTSNGTEKLITVNGNGALTLKYGGPDLGGPRVYLIEEDGVNKNHLLVITKKRCPHSA